MQTIKFKIFSLLVLVGALCLSSCTHNNGDVGPWFGTWALESITINGEQSPDYQHNILWKFQSDVFSMQTVSSSSTDHSYSQVWGTWSTTADSSNNLMVIEFGYTQDKDPSIYTPFPETRLNPDGKSILKIISQSGGNASLQYTAESGEVIEYILHKQ